MVQDALLRRYAPSNLGFKLGIRLGKLVVLELPVWRLSPRHECRPDQRRFANPEYQRP